MIKVLAYDEKNKRKILAYYVDEEEQKVPAIDRLSFKKLIKYIRKEDPGAAIFVAWPKLLGPTEENYCAAMRKLKQNSIDAFFSTDPPKEELDKVVQDERIKSFKEQVEASGLTIKLYPFSGSYKAVGTTRSYMLKGEGFANIYLTHEDLLNDAAHELMHLMMDNEGYHRIYATLPEKTSALESETLMEACDSVLDIEVNRRIEQCGFSPRNLTDKHAINNLEYLKTKEISKDKYETADVMSRLIFRYFTTDEKMQTEYVNIVRMKYPEAHIAAQDIIKAIKDFGLDSSEKANLILKMTAETLTKMGIPAKSGHITEYLQILKTLSGPSA